MTNRKTVKIINAAVEAVGDQLILRGAIDSDSLDLLRVDKYQREELGGKKITDLMVPVCAGSAPDVELGMRGGDCRFVTEDDGSETVYLQNETYIVDGLQRITAGKKALEMDVGEPRLGAKIYFETDYKFEKMRFEVLNQERTKVSPNIIMKNLMDEFPVVDMLHYLCLEKNFALYKRVCWGQRKKKGELLDIRPLAKVALLLHRKFTGNSSASSPRDLATALQGVYEKVGRNTMRNNIIELFDALDAAFTVRNITYREQATQLTVGFLTSMCRVLCTYEVYWQGNKLQIDKQTRNKLVSFNLQDPYVKELAGNRSTGATILAQLLTEHINKGRRTRRLVA